MSKFEWDNEKEKINLKKHGLSLEAGISVFNDAYRLEFLDNQVNSAGEDRYITIGRSEILALQPTLVIAYRDARDIWRLSGQNP